MNILARWDARRGAGSVASVATVAVADGQTRADRSSSNPNIYINKIICFHTLSDTSLDGQSRTRLPAPATPATSSTVAEPQRPVAATPPAADRARPYAPATPTTVATPAAPFVCAACGAPPADRRAGSDMVKVPGHDLAGPLNVWLHAGCLDAQRRRRAQALGEPQTRDPDPSRLTSALDQTGRLRGLPSRPADICDSPAPGVPEKPADTAPRSHFAKWQLFQGLLSRSQERSHGTHSSAPTDAHRADPPRHGCRARSAFDAGVGGVGELVG